MTEVKTGWWWPLNANKAHYMVGAFSLCGRWMCWGTGENYDDSNDTSPDNCKACLKKKAKVKEIASAGA